MKHLLSLILLSIALSINASTPLTGLLERIDKGASKKINFEITSSTGCRKEGRSVGQTGEQSDGRSDFFELDSRGGKPLIRANNYISAAVGLNWYLKYHCGIHLSWNCMKVTLPAQMPLVKEKERHETDLSLRYDFNYCTFSYSMPFWDWERWQTEIDWMALHGINMPLAAVGHECVWRNMLLRLGYSDDEVGRFIAGPAFLAWWEMNNLEGWGGPLPLNWYKRQEALQKQILRRMHEYGMQPVLPGYSGMRPSFQAKNDVKSTSHEIKADESGNISEELESEESAQSSIQLWNGFTRPGVIMPNDHDFDRYAKLFYEETERLYGKAEYYSIDPFHEAKNLPEDLDIGEAGKKIMATMKEYGGKDSKWVLQGWSENPRNEMIAAIEPGDLLILDLFSECRPQYGDPNSIWYRPEGYMGHKWLFCMLENFGANVGLHGRIDQLLENYYTARSQYNQHLVGWGLTMEGIETNPFMYELMSELPWRKEQINKEEWVAEFIEARYGARHDARYGAQQADVDEHSKKKLYANPIQAWTLLSQTILNCPRGNNQQGPSESIFCSRPSLNSYQASSWSKMIPYYSAKSTAHAAMLMTKAQLEVKQAFELGLINETAYENFCYDLVDVQRQANADEARTIYHQSIADFQNFDSEAFRQHSEAFLQLLLRQDSLLSTRPEFTVERWLRQARQRGTNAAEKDLYEWNARVQITTWGDRYCADTGKLRDYAHKEWSGLLREFYYPRWQHFFGILQQELDGNLPMCPIGNSSTKTDGNPATSIDWYGIEEPWTKRRLNEE